MVPGYEEDYIEIASSPVQIEYVVYDQTFMCNAHVHSISKEPENLEASWARLYQTYLRPHNFFDNFDDDDDDVYTGHPC